jgi:hypothetical protein
MVNPTMDTQLHPLCPRFANNLGLGDGADGFRDMTVGEGREGVRGEMVLGGELRVRGARVVVG